MRMRNNNELKTIYFLQNSELKAILFSARYYKERKKRISIIRISIILLPVNMRNSREYKNSGTFQTHSVQAESKLLPGCSVSAKMPERAAAHSLRVACNREIANPATVENVKTAKS